MEETIKQGDAVGVIAGSTQGKNAWLIVGVVVFAILALSGAAFGVCGMVEVKSKASEISYLKAKIENEEKITMSQGIEETEVGDNENVATGIVADDSMIIDSDKYLYVVEMGIKIDLGSELKNVSVLVRHSDGQTRIWGTKGDDAHFRVAANMDFAEPMSNTTGIGHLARYEKGSGNILENWTKVFEYDNYDVYYWHSSGTTDAPSGDINRYISDRDAAFEIIDSVFMDSANYSKI